MPNITTMAANPPYSNKAERTVLGALPLQNVPWFDMVSRCPGAIGPRRSTRKVVRRSGSNKRWQLGEPLDSHARYGRYGRREPVGRPIETPAPAKAPAVPVAMPLSQRLGLIAFVRRLRTLQNKRRDNSDAIIGTVLDGWRLRCYPALPRSGLRRFPRLSTNPAVLSFVEFLSHESVLDAAYFLSSAYALLIDEGRRHSLAMFFTPPPLTERLLDDLGKRGVNFRVNNFCDPACGGAAFIAPIALRIRSALLQEGRTPLEILKHVETHICGADKDRTLAALSRCFVLMALYADIRATQYVPTLRISTTNSLSEMISLTGKIDVVLSNPPFRKMKKSEVKPYRKRYAMILEGQPNLYGLFIALCVGLLKKRGLCALVTPTSFLSGRDFSKLRKFLKGHTEILGIDLISDRSGVFIDVEQETALTTIRRKGSANEPVTTTIGCISRNGNYSDLGQGTLPSDGSAWPVPRAPGDVALLSNAGRSAFRLLDYGFVPRIGSFVWNRDERPTYKSKTAVRRSRSKNAVPLLWSSDIKQDGRLHFDGNKKANDEPCFVNLGSKDHSAVVRRASVLLQRVTSNDQPRRLVAAPVPRAIFDVYGGFVGENHTVILEQVTDLGWSPAQLAGLMKSAVVDRYFRCISGSTNVSVFELSQLPLPDPALLRSLLVKGNTVQAAAWLALLGSDKGQLGGT